MVKIEKNLKLNFGRFFDSLYSIENIWQRESYDWPGDWEGRALLAFVCHYNISGEKIPCMDSLISSFELHLNDGGYLGKMYGGDYADEQQLSGHSWLLRGLCSYYETFRKDFVLNYAKRIVENLFLPVINRYREYPVHVKRNIGGVSGKTLSTVNGWNLSSDIGCAFMAIDGLSHYYSITGDERIKEMLTVMIEKFISLDFLSMHVQTHATLSATRSIISFYEKTKEKRYLDYVLKIYDMYLHHGMTLTYENFNWFGREESWTEPCAIVDSFIIALKMYKITNKNEYRKLARRIWFNGLQFCLRANGGAGPNTCVTKKSPILKVSMYEAPFCCTMRYAECLYYAVEYREILTENRTGNLEKDEYGRYFDGDEIVAENSRGEKIYLSDLCGTENQLTHSKYKILS